MTVYEDSHDWEAGGSGVRHISIDTRSSKCLVRPPTDHCKRLLDEAHPNYPYPDGHKLKDYGMIKAP
jgi:hypothetical protein